MSDSSNQGNVLNKFMKYLGRNRMGQTFLRFVSSSVDKRRLKTQNTERRYQSMNTKQIKQEKLIALPSHKKLKTNPNQTVTSFVINQSTLGHSVKLIDSVTPVINTLAQTMLRSRQLSFREWMNITKLNSFNSLIIDLSTPEAQQFFKKREELIKFNQLELILTTLTGKSNIGKLRIYKDRLKKFYNARYYRQKLTTFFEYEYIQDYDSQLKYLQTMLSLTLQEVHFLCFITLDINSDGLICNDDLFSLATVNADQNPLIDKDVYKIFKYMSQFHNMKSDNSCIIDQLADDELSKDPAPTIQKYRLSIMRLDKQNIAQSQKKQTKSSIKKSIKMSLKADHKGIVMTRKVNKHLFSLKTEQQQGEAAIKQLRKRFAEYTLESRSNFKFKINFQRYQLIFKNIIPQTYFDLLYVQGGIKLDGKKYCELNFDLDIVQKKDTIRQEFDRYKYFKGTVNDMRDTFRGSRIQKFNTYNYNKYSKSM